MTAAAGEVRVTLTLAEADRLYASAASYETTVSRVEGVGEATAEVAQSALTKLAEAIAEATS